MDIKRRIKKFARRSFLVTGGAGFIGSHLVESLLELGAKVVVVDDFSTGKKENLKNVLRDKKLKIIKADVNSFEEIKKVFDRQRIYYVFHLSSLVGVKRVETEPLGILEDLNGIKNILELSRKHKVEKLVFASSSEVVAEPLIVLEKEKISHNERDVYGLVKTLGEKLTQIYHEREGVPGCALRFYNVYGPRQDSSDQGFVIGIFMRQVLEGKSPTVLGDGLQTRDFMFVKDGVEAAIRAILSEKATGEIIDVGRGRQITILGLAERIIELSGKGLKPEFLPERKTDIRYQCPDVKKMRSLLKFVPKCPLDKGLEMTYEWYKKNLS
jgi:nucleoside-diphosphate-sugar epimerase